MIPKFPKPPKDNENGKSKYVLMKKVIVHATTAEKNDDHKVYASMARMSINEIRSSEKYGDSL